jgi:predicted thioredoxin/glutaredoxin
VSGAAKREITTIESMLIKGVVVDISCEAQCNGTMLSVSHVLSIILTVYIYIYKLLDTFFHANQFSMVGSTCSLYN